MPIAFKGFPHPSLLFNSQPGYVIEIAPDLIFPEESFLRPDTRDSDTVDTLRWPLRGLVDSGG
jgi:hypothetical protein